MSSRFSADGTYISASAGRKDRIKLVSWCFEPTQPDRVMSVRRGKTEEGCIVPLKMRRTPKSLWVSWQVRRYFFSGEESMWWVGEYKVLPADPDRSRSICRTVLTMTEYLLYLFCCCGQQRFIIFLNLLFTFTEYFIHPITGNYLQCQLAHWSSNNQTTKTKQKQIVITLCLIVQHQSILCVSQRRHNAFTHTCRHTLQQQGALRIFQHFDNRILAGIWHVLVNGHTVIGIRLLFIFTETNIRGRRVFNKHIRLH